MDENELSDYHNLAEIDSTIQAKEMQLECQSFFCPPEVTGLYFGKHGRRYRNTGNINENGISEEEKILRKCRNEYVVDNFGRPFLRIMYPVGIRDEIKRVVESKIASCLQQLSGHKGTLVMQPYRLQELIPLNTITPVLVLGVLSYDTVVIRILNNEARHFQMFADKLHNDYAALYAKGETCSLTLPANWNSIVIGLHPVMRRYCRGFVVRILNSNEPSGESLLQPCFLLWWVDYGGISPVRMKHVFKISYRYLMYRNQALCVNWILSGPADDMSTNEQNRILFEELFRNNMIYAINLMDRPCCTGNCVFLAHTKPHKVKGECLRPALSDLVDLLSVANSRGFVKIQHCVGHVDYPEEFQTIQKFLPYKELIRKQNELHQYDPSKPEKRCQPNCRTGFYEEFYTNAHPVRFESKSQTLNCKTYNRSKDVASKSNQDRQTKFS